MQIAVEGSGVEGAGKDEPMSLEGSPADYHPDDARHWVSVYAELVGTMDRLLEATADRQEVGELQLLRARSEYFRRRLEFWQSVEAQPAPINP